MNHNQLNRLKLIQSTKHDLDPDIVLKDNKLFVEARITKQYEYIIWLFLLIGIPGYFILDNPSIQTLLIAVFLLLGLTYLLYDSVIASNQIIIDLDLKEIIITPNDPVISKLRLSKRSKLLFEQIVRTRLIDKSFGRGQPSGKRLYVETNAQKLMKLVDFRNGVSAEKFESLLSELLEIRLIRK